MKEAPYRYRPANSTEIGADGLGVVYLTTTEAGRFCAIGYRGKSGKASFNYSFPNAENRAAYVNGFIERLKASAAYKAEQKAERLTATHTLKVGDILSNSWGYDQTNIDWYVVVAVPSNKTVKIREICGTTTETGFMCGHTIPVQPVEFAKESPVMLRRATGTRANMKYGSASLWDGKPERCSWYA